MAQKGVDEIQNGTRTIFVEIISFVRSQLVIPSHQDFNLKKFPVADLSTSEAVIIYIYETIMNAKVTSTELSGAEYWTQVYKPGAGFSG